MSGWIRVSRHEPCPVCGKSDYCTRTADGVAVKCMRVESDSPVTDAKGGFSGWLHKLSNPLPPAPLPKQPPKKPIWNEECQEMYFDERAHEMRATLAEKLHVSISALEDLRVGWGRDEWNGAVFSSWPSRGADGNCIGYTRRYSDGSKRTNPGGSLGLFYTVNWHKHPGPVWIVEGGSDVAACESAGLCAIGRGSNTHGSDLIRRLLEKCPSKRVIVVGERDETPSRRGTVASCTPHCRGCSFCWPGLYGAKKVAGELGVQWVLVPQPYKDMRELITSGGLWLDLMELL